MLYTDPLRLQQVIINLLNNALKFTPDGGSITLDYEIDEEDQCMLFSVTDTGSGIPEDKQELVFQRFEAQRICAGNRLGTGDLQTDHTTHGRRYLD